MADEGRLTRLIRFITDRASLDKVRDDARQALDEGTKPPTRNFRAIEAGLERVRRVALRVGAVLAAALGARAVLNLVRESVQASMMLEAEQRKLEVQLRNTGIAWEDVSAQVQAVSADLWDTHRLVGGEVVPIFRTLVGITEDYAGSLLNVGLVADIAAGANISLETSARLVGKVMMGNNEQLREYGIVLEEGADAITVLRERFDGLAAAAITPVQELTKAWGDFKEELGATISQVTGNENALDSLTGTIRSLNSWIAVNRDTIVGFSRAVIGAVMGIERVVRFFSTPFIEAFKTMAWGVANWRDLTTLAVANVALAITDLVQGIERDFGRFAARFGFNLSPSDRLAEVRAGWEAIRQEARRGLLNTADEVARIDPYAGLVPRPRVVAEEVGEVVEAVQEAMTFNLAIPGQVDFDFGGLLPRVPDLEQRFNVLTDIFRERMAVWADVSQTAAGNFTAAWEDAFTLLLRDFDNVGKAGEQLARGLAAGFLGALAQYAQSKVSENIALAAENVAKGLAASVTPGMQGAAAGFYAAAKGNVGAAALWGVLAGASGGAANAVGGPGAAPAGGTVAASRPSGGDFGRPEVHVYIDPFDAMNPVHYKQVGMAVQNVAQTSGSDIIVHRGRARR